MNFLQDYGFSGVIGLLAAIAFTVWLQQPDLAANTMVFAVTFLIVTGVAQGVSKLWRRRKPRDDGPDDPTH